MVELDLSLAIDSSSVVAAVPRPPVVKKKADVVEHLKVFVHVGLLVNEPLGVLQPGCSSSSRPTTSIQVLS
jgi:hypothetical protein